MDKMIEVKCSMIDFNKITTPYLIGEITYEQWIDNLYEEFVRVIEEMIMSPVSEE